MSIQTAAGEATIPLVDLAAQDREVWPEIETGLRRVVEASAFINGSAVQTFERTYARFCGVRHCVGVANGTDALELALRASGVRAGDEVILPANSFIATAEAVARIGARPALVDVDPRHHLIDPDACAARVGSRTRAIVPVHLYGQMANLEPLCRLAARYELAVVEDAAQAHGASQAGLAPGVPSTAVATSFYPGKNLGAHGDAGAVLTESEAIAARVRRLGNHGSERRYEHLELGFNSRLDTVQAVVLLAKLRRLAAWNDARRTAATRYSNLLASLPGVILPETAPGNDHAWHLYVVQVPNRDAVLHRLNQAGIAAAVHYPVPIHLHGAFRSLGHATGDFPVAEALAGRILSLPLYPHLTARQQERVAEQLALAMD